MCDLYLIYILIKNKIIINFYKFILLKIIYYLINLYITKNNVKNKYINIIYKYTLLFN